MMETAMEQPAARAGVLEQRLERAGAFFLLVFTFFTPYPHLSTIREVGYYLAVACYGLYLARNRDLSVLRTPLTLPVALFTAWAFVGLFFALDREGSIHDFTSHLLEYILLFVCYVTFLRDQGRVRLLFAVLLAAIALASGYELYLWFGKLGMPWHSRLCIPRHQSPVGPVGFMALFAMLAGGYLWFGERQRWRRAMILVAMLPLLLTLFATQMRSLWLAVPLVLAALLWERKRMLAVVLVVLLVPGVVFLKTYRQANLLADNSRLTINYISLLILQDHPWLGIGFGIDSYGKPGLLDLEGYRARVPARFRSAVELTSQHSMWLGIATRTGVVGFLLFCWLWFTWLAMGLRLVRRAGDGEIRLLGRLGIAVWLLFSVYGLFNVVFMHFLETLLCLGFALTAAGGRLEALSRPPTRLEE